MSFISCRTPQSALPCAILWSANYRTPFCLFWMLNVPNRIILSVPRLTPPPSLVCTVVGTHILYHWKIFSLSLLPTCHPALWMTSLLLWTHRCCRPTGVCACPPFWYLVSPYPLWVNPTDQRYKVATVTWVSTKVVEVAVISRHRAWDIVCNCIINNRYLLCSYCGWVKGIYFTSLSLNYFKDSLIYTEYHNICMDV